MLANVAESDIPLVSLSDSQLAVNVMAYPNRVFEGRSLQNLREQLIRIHIGTTIRSEIKDPRERAASRDAR